ncbi:XRE family transcriptional regulator [Abyssogena phaseoliformis symbiont OG214]|uniref:helix-turn-helix domain-containing protein n=1 Tax=Abyssogena phaseoliformis symbiont TaxID=596095 RepID=UPI0019167DB3|nr:helix-turn-helix domain-containing protein [Abyssogena phaseoliformis symbiont]BBB22576.1 XRE family transcriptional regulator [Abyssogena phaseoliformis symbiont OG214]
MNTTLIGGKFIAIEDALKTFGEQIKFIRKQQKIIQRRLSEHCNVSLTVIKRVESGKPISTINLMRILTSLGKLSLLIDLYKQPDTSPMEVWKAEKYKL